MPLSSSRLARRPTPLLLARPLVALAALCAAAAVAHASRLTLGPARVLTVRDGLPHDGIRCLRLDGDDLWVGADRGLALLRGGAWRAWTARDGLPYNAIADIAIDPRTRDVWLGTWGGGLVRLSAGRFDTFDQLNSGLAGNLVFAVAVAGGRIWAATNGGLSSFDPVRDAWDLHAEPRADAPQTAIVSLWPRPDSIFVAAWCEGLRRLDLGSGEWTRINRPSQPPAEPAHAPRAAADSTIAVTGAGRAIWWVTQRELFRRTPDGNWQPLSPDFRSVSAGFILCAAARGENEIWLGTDDGLCVLPDAADPDDTWLIHRRADDGRPQTTAVRHGRAEPATLAGPPLPDNTVRCIAFDPNGAWVGTARGLLRLGPTPSPTIDDAIPVRPPSPSESQAPPSDESAPPAVHVGVLGPFARVMSLPGASRIGRATGRVDLYAVQLALAETNRSAPRPAAGRLEPLVETGGFGRYGWGLPEDDIAMFLRAGAVGIVGHVAPDHRIATATLLRTELPFVNAAATPPTADELENPWLFRCPSNDPAFLAAVLDAAIDSLAGPRIAIIRTPGPLTQIRLDAWAAHARRRGRPPVFDVGFDPFKGDGSRLAADLRRVDAAFLLTWADADTSAALVHGLRAAGLTQTFVGSDWIVRDDFAARVGCDPGALLAPAPCRHRRDLVTDELARQYAVGGLAREAGYAPGANAMLSFDAALHLAEAVHAAGDDPRAVRRELARMSAPAVARRVAGRWVIEPCPTADARAKQLATDARGGRY